MGNGRVGKKLGEKRFVAWWVGVTKRRRWVELLAERAAPY